MSNLSNVNNNMFEEQKALLRVYRDTSAYTIKGLTEAIESLKYCCNLDVPEGVREIYKRRSEELEGYLFIIEGDY